MEKHADCLIRLVFSLSQRLERVSGSTDVETSPNRRTWYYLIKDDITGLCKATRFSLRYFGLGRRYPVDSHQAPVALRALRGGLRK